MAKEYGGRAFCFIFLYGAEKNEQRKILLRTVITINQNQACYKIWLGCSSDANQLVFEINRAVTIYASKGLGSFSFE